MTQHNDTLLVADLYVVYPILGGLRSLPSLSFDLIPDSTFSQIINFLDSKQQPDITPFNAIPSFLHIVSPLFDAERIPHLKDITRQNKLERLKAELESIDKNDPELEQERLKIRGEIAGVEAEKKNDTNPLAEMQIQQLAKSYGGNEEIASLVLWINSLREFSGYTTQQLESLPFSKFIELSNQQQTIENIKYAYELQASSKNKQKQPPTPFK